MRVRDKARTRREAREGRCAEKKKKKQDRLYSPLGFSGELECGESWGSAVARTWKMWEDETKMPRKDEKEDEEKAEKE